MGRDLERLRQALRTVLPGGDAITSVSPLTTGFSNETYVIDGLDMILRLPPAAGAMLDGHDVVTQGRIYAELPRLPDAPPVPRVVAIGADLAAVGDPYFIMERVQGASIDDLETPAWLTGGSDALRGQVCRTWVAAFSRLATLPTLEVLGPVISPDDDARRWRTFAQAADSARLVGLFDRLLATPAPISGPPAIIHGDPKLSNLMWQDGEVTAVLDWEMALNGDPLADLGYMLYFFASDHHVATRVPKLSGMLTRSQVIAQWSEVSGRSSDGLAWHEIAQAGKIAAIIAEGMNMYVTGRSTDPKLAQFAKTLDYYIGVMAAMLDAAGL